MRRIVTVIVVLVALVPFALTAAAGAVVPYGWSLSGSSTDPNQNTGAPVANGQVPVFLWLVCIDPLGAAAMECALQHTFAFEAGSFIAMNGALATGAPDLLLAIPCATKPTLFGQQSYFDVGTGGTVCMGPSALSGKNVTVDCDQVNPQEQPNAVRGFDSTGGEAPCTIDECTGVPVEATSWGSLKSLYR